MQSTETPKPASYGTIQKRGGRMFSVGSKVVHPCHGAGVIESIETKHFAGSHHTYFVIDILDPARATQVMVPVRGTAKVGLRPAGRPSKLRAQLARCQERLPDGELAHNFKRRKIIAQERLKSGSFRQIVDLLRCILRIGQNRKLSFSDREWLKDGKVILATELAVAEETDLDEAMEVIESRLALTPRPLPA